MRYCLLFSFFACWIGAATADQPDIDRYQKPGARQVGGVRDLCLIYHGNRSRPQWNADALLPYIARVDESGRPKEWLFDSFLWIEFRNDREMGLQGDAPAARADWQWMMDAWFRTEAGLEQMEEAVIKAGESLRDLRHKVNIVLTIPIPQRGFRGFGSIREKGKPLDFTREEDRQQAIAWYIEECMRRWKAEKFKHLRLVGFYWVAESIVSADYDLVRRTSDYLHRRSQRLFWIPYAGAEGVVGWRDRGIDAVMMQPNLFFAEKNESKWLVWAANGARKNGCGIEIEFDGRALTLEDYRQRLFAYLDAGAKYGWMNSALLGYYEGGGALGQFAASPGAGFKLYEAICEFVKGRYRPSGQTPLPDLQPVSSF